MNERQIKLVQHSFIKVAPGTVTSAGVFYRKLFELAPSLAVLFTQDLQKQSEMLMKVLAMAVNSLYDLQSITVALEALGKRHVDYGVKDEHYAYVEQALIWMLEDVLQDEFNDELREAWQAVFKTISDIMKGDHCFNEQGFKVAV